MEVGSVSRFSDNYAAAGGPAVNLFWMHGESVTYTPPGDGAEAVPLTAILGPEELDEQADDEGRRQRRVRDCTIRTDPDADEGGVAEPRLTADVVFGTTLYSVESIKHTSDSVHVLKLLRIGRAEHSRPDFRRT